MSTEPSQSRLSDEPQAPADDGPAESDSSSIGTGNTRNVYDLHRSSNRQPSFVVDLTKGDSVDNPAGVPDNEDGTRENPIEIPDSDDEDEDTVHWTGAPRVSSGVQRPSQSSAAPGSNPKEKEIAPEGKSETGEASAAEGSVAATASVTIGSDETVRHRVADT